MSNIYDGIFWKIENGNSRFKNIILDQSHKHLYGQFQNEGRDNFFENVLIALSYGQYEFDPNPGNTYLFKFSKRNSRKKCEICSKLIIKTPE